jgi:hypothetical protein
MLRFIGGFLILFFGLNGCATKVNTFYDPSAPYDEYQTFCWFDNCQFTIDGPVYVRRDSATVEAFKNAIVDELEQKGYRYDQNNPDFLLYMHIVVEEQETKISSAYETGDSEDWQGAFPIMDWMDQTYVYLKGSIIIDIADANESKMVWRSDVVEYLDVVYDIGDSRLKKGVKKALKKFPPN